MSEAAISTIVIDNWYDDPDAIRKHAIKHMKQMAPLEHRRKFRE